MTADSLFVVLASGPFRKYARGTKTVEIRNDAPSWAAKHVYEGRPIRLRRGYSTPDEITGHVGRVARFQGLRRAPVWVLAGACLEDLPDSEGYFARNGPLVAFEVHISTLFVQSEPPTAN